MGKTRDLYKKIRDIKGIFHAKMGSVKDRNGMDLTEAEDIKKRWQEYTEELYKKRHRNGKDLTEAESIKKRWQEYTEEYAKRSLNDPDNHGGVITHLEPDILECEVKDGP